jgi:hypothetical protein
MVKEQRDEIILGSHYPDVSVSGGELSNTTQSKGMRLAQLETGWPELIQYALEMIPMEQGLIVKYRYFEGRSPDVVADKLHISRTLYYAWRDNLMFFLVLKATQKGLIDPFV